MMAKKVRTRRPTRVTRLGIATIVGIMRQLREDDYERVLPDITTQEVVEIEDAVDWMDQYSFDDWNEG